MFTDAAYAYALPALLAAHTFFLAAGRRDNSALAASLFVWQTALGTRHFLNHLALDRANDICSGVSTLATIKGSRYIHALIRHAILPIELLGFLGYLLVMNQYARFMPFVVAAIFAVDFVSSHCPCDRPQLSFPDLSFLEDSTGLAVPGRSSAGFVVLSRATRSAVLCAPVRARAAVRVIRESLQALASTVTSTSRGWYSQRPVAPPGFLCSRRGDWIACPADEFQPTSRRFARQYRSGQH